MPILVVAWEMKMVRTIRPMMYLMLYLIRANGFSTKEWIFERRLFVNQARAGITLALVFFYGYEKQSHSCAAMSHSSASATRPYQKTAIVACHKLRQLRSVIAGVSDLPSADQTMASINADVILVTKGRDRNIRLVR